MITYSNSSFHLETSLWPPKAEQRVDFPSPVTPISKTAFAQNLFILTCPSFSKSTN